MKYGYVRVSTPNQRKGTSLSSQREQLISAGAEAIVEDVYTGSTMDRLNLSKLISSLIAGDSLLVCKLDRLARTVCEGATLIKDLHEKGITVEILNMGRIDDSTMGRLLLNVTLSFAEYERDMIVERMAEGKDRARQNGKRVDGRPRKHSLYQLDHAMQLLQNNSFTEVEKLTNISRSTLTRERRKRRNQGE